MSRWPVAGPSGCWLLASRPASKKQSSTASSEDKTFRQSLTWKCLICVFLQVITHRPAHILQCYSKAPIKWVQFELASSTTTRPGTHGFSYARTMNTSLGSCMNVTYPTSCVQYLILLFDFNEIWSLWTFLWRITCQFLRKSFQWEPRCSMRTDKTYMTKLTIAFRYFANAPNDKLMEI